MKKGCFSKITISAFLLISSAAAPAFADSVTLGGASTWDDNNIGIGTGVITPNPGDIAIGSSYTDPTTGTAINSAHIEYSSNVIAIGSGSRGDNNGLALGTGAKGDAGMGGATGVGYYAAGGDIYSTAFGSNSGIGEAECTAIGSSAKTVNGKGDTATGAGAAVNNKGGTASGYNSVANGTYSSAFGEGTNAKGSYSTALGAEATAKAAYSVALGDKSVADRANSVSVGSAKLKRQITNVAEGTADTDAANVGQVHKLGALAAAMAGLTPMAYDGKERLQILANAGSYAGEQATALGVGYYDATKSLMLTTGMAFSGSETMTRLGIAWKPGRAGGKEAMLADCSDTQATLQQQDAQIQQMQDQLKQQEEEAKQQEQQTKEKQAQLKELQDQVNRLLQKRIW